MNGTERMPQNLEERFATVDEYNEARENLKGREAKLEELERKLHIEFIGVKPADDKRTRKDFFEDWPEDVKEKYDSKKAELRKEEEEIESRRPLNLIIKNSIKKIEEI